MINDPIDRPAPVPGLGPDSWDGLTDEAIGIRQRTAAGRDLAAHVDRHRSTHAISEEEREATPGLVPGTKQNRPTKVRQVSSRPARHVPGAGQPDQAADRPKSRAAATHGSKPALPPVEHRNPARF